MTEITYLVSAWIGVGFLRRSTANCQCLGILRSFYSFTCYTTRHTCHMSHGMVHHHMTAHAVKTQVLILSVGTEDIVGKSS